MLGKILMAVQVDELEREGQPVGLVLERRPAEDVGEPGKEGVEAEGEEVQRVLVGAHDEC